MIEQPKVPPARTPDSVELESAMIRVGRLRPASEADWVHALAVVLLAGVTVEVTVVMRQGQPWEITYRRSA